jgi:hypothetical protein
MRAASVTLTPPDTGIRAGPPGSLGIPAAYDAARETPRRRDFGNAPNAHANPSAIVSEPTFFRSEETMAKQVITVLTDDLDGGDADRTIEFGLDGVNYTIDLSEKNVGKLRKALDPYLAVASRVGRSGTNGRIVTRAARTAAPARANRDQNQAIREWAVKNGYEVSERGRIPGSIVEAFHAKR